MFSRWFLGLIAYISLAAPVHVLASVTVSPLLIDHTVEAREMFDQAITLTNTSGTPLRLFASVHQITLDEGGAIASFVPPSMSDNTTAVTSWIAIDRGRIELAPGETRAINASFRINPNAKPGLYHAFIAFGTGSNRDEAEGKTLAGKSSGAIVRINIDDNRVELLRLSRFAVDRFVTTAGEHEITYSVTNPGDMPLVPEGEVILYNARGEEVAAITINTGKKTLAPGETAEFAEPLSPDGLFGKYKAFLTLEYGTTQRTTLHDTAFFYAAPFPYLAGLFVGLFLCTLGLLFFWRRALGTYDDHHDDGHVAMYVRREVVSESTDHDINLKQSS